MRQLREHSCLTCQCLLLRRHQHIDLQLPNVAADFSDNAEQQLQLSRVQRLSVADAAAFERRAIAAVVVAQTVAAWQLFVVLAVAASERWVAEDDAVAAENMTGNILIIKIILTVSKTK